MTSGRAAREEAPGRGRLLRTLGAGFGLAVSVGATIGIGILRTPGLMAAQLNSTMLVLVVFVLGSLYALLGANVTAELSTMLPQAGGPYVYARRAFGDFGGFVVGWGDWLINTAAEALVAVGLSEYAASLLGWPHATVPWITAVVLLALAALHGAGVRIGSRVQEGASVLLIAALLALVASCFFLGAAAPAPAGMQQPSAQHLTPGALAIAFQSVIITYAGWNSAAYFAEENSDPGRALPRALLGTVAVVTGIYLLVLLAIIHTVPLAQLSRSSLAAADAAQRVFGGRGAQIITGLAVLSLASNLNAGFMYTPRTLLALGRDGLFASRATDVTEGGTPGVALAVTTVVAIALAVTGTFGQLLALFALLGVANSVLLDGSLLLLRRREPHLHRPYRAIAYPWSVVLLLVVDLALLIGFLVADRRDSLAAIVLLALSFPAFVVVKRMMTGPRAESVHPAPALVMPTLEVQLERPAPEEA